MYHRRGEIHSSGGYDTYPENQHGDICGLKDYANDDDARGTELLDILLKAHCHWIREADVDSFRVDAVKHMGELACSRFCMRKALFDHAVPGRNLLNPDCAIYREIAAIARVVRGNECLRFGRMYLRDISADGTQFGRPYGTNYTLAFSRILYGREALVAYNVSDQPRNDCVIVDADIHKQRKDMKYLYGKAGTEAVRSHLDPNNPGRFVRLHLEPRQFVILE